MPPPSPNQPVVAYDDKTLAAKVLSIFRGQVITAVAGFFDRLTVSGDINARNLTTTGAVTPRLVKTNFKARRSTTAGGQTFVNATVTKVSFDHVEYDPLSLMSSATDFAVPVDGVYAISGRVAFTTGATTSGFATSIWVSGVQVVLGLQLTLAFVGATTYVAPVDAQLTLKAGQLVSINFFQNSGANWNQAGGNLSDFSIHYLSS